MTQIARTAPDIRFRSRKDRILLVDDEPNVLDALAWHLEKRFEILISSRPTEALNLLQHEPVTAIVSDLRMPVMDGIKFLHESRQYQPDAARLLLTGYADMGATIQAVNVARVHRFLTKPCPAPDLAANIAAVLVELGRATAAPMLRLVHGGDPG